MDMEYLRKEMLCFVCIELLLVLLLCGIGLWQSKYRRPKHGWGRAKKTALNSLEPTPNGRHFPVAKPDWVRQKVLEMYLAQPCSHRTLAANFNRLYAAQTGMTVGRTWVGELIKQQAYDELHAQREWKHHIPPATPANAQWAIDTTGIRDQNNVQQIALGIIDHGTRKCLLLRQVRRFNAWTFLGMLFLAFGEFGRPKAIKTDNCTVFHARLTKKVLGFCRVRMRYSAPGKPWQNGRIERFFGTLKERLRGYAIRDAQHLNLALAQFQFWYNAVRPHQHLYGSTPDEAWLGLDVKWEIPLQVKTYQAWDGHLRGSVLRH